MSSDLARFTSLKSVPTLAGAKADLTRYPARRGYEDLVMLSADPRDRIGWTVVAFPRQRFAWFALKDPRVLASTIFWISNAGRHYAPWSGRHINVMGIEDVTANFHRGLAESAAANPISRSGIPTHVKLNPTKPLVVNYIMGVVALPTSYDGSQIRLLSSTDGKGIVLTWKSGGSVASPVDTSFLYTRA